MNLSEEQHQEPLLLRQTVRSVVILTTACVVFVALLSTASLFLVQRALPH
jgi:hypothetical protein